MPSTTDQQKPGLFALFLGDPNTWKSCEAADFPTPYYFDLDNKRLTAIAKRYQGKKVDYDNFESIIDVFAKMEDFRKGCPYETLVFDSITAGSSLAIRTIQELKGEPTPQMLQKLKTTKGGDKMIELMSIDYYNGEHRALEFLCAQAKALWLQEGNPKYVIIIAHVLTTESAPDLKTGIVKRSSRIVTYGRAIAALIESQFDDVFLFSSEVNPFNSEESTVQVCTNLGSGDFHARTTMNLPAKIDLKKNRLYSSYLKGQI